MDSSRDRSIASPRVASGIALGLLVSAIVVGWFEWDRLRESGSVASLLFNMNVDTTPFALLLLLAPVCYLLRPVRLRGITARSARVLGDWLRESPSGPESSAPAGGWKPVVRAWSMALAVGVIAFLSCVRVSQFVVEPTQGFRFGELPPAIHDEYSYLLQAETFRAGRWSWPGHPDVPRVFDQMHVLNEGQFASRYFPGTGAWITPWLVLGNPYPGHWLATAITCMLVFAIGRELSCNGTGLLAGSLAALSPSLALFGNLLLAHQPTLVGITLFVFAFLRLQRTLRDSSGSGPAAECAPAEKVRSTGQSILFWSAASSVGLTFAMLCRPMSAAGIGFPAGLWLVQWTIRHAKERRIQIAGLIAAYAVPLLIGFGILIAQNLAVTGQAFRTPYQEYTELLTPRHMYGFNNVERARVFEEDNPRVLTGYNQWAENLDAKRAARNAWYRCLGSFQWSLGIVPIALLSCVFLLGAARNVDARWWLIPAAIVSIHVAHIPYWYDGILHWHYVFESNVLWCLLLAAGTTLFVRYFNELDRPWMSGWAGAVLLAGVMVNQVVVDPLWTQSRLAAGANEFGFSRVHYHVFRKLIENRVTRQPAIVLVRHQPDDISIDYVSNHPSLTDDVLIGRHPLLGEAAEADTIAAVRKAFPDRAMYEFDVATGDLYPISGD